MSGRYHWDGYSHRQLYDMIHGGSLCTPDGSIVPAASPGGGGPAPSGAWKEFVTLMQNAEERTNQALSKAGAEWEGQAADAARMGITPLAQWANDAGTAGQASQAGVTEQVDSYSSAKNKMPEPVPVTSTANSDWGGIPAGITHLVGGQTDQDKQEQAAQNAKAEAVRVMGGYESNSSSATSRLGQFTPPPEVVVDVPSPQPTGSTIDGGPGTVSPGGGGGHTWGGPGTSGGGQHSVAPPPSGGSNWTGGVATPPAAGTDPASVTPPPTTNPAAFPPGSSGGPGAMPPGTGVPPTGQPPGGGPGYGPGGPYGGPYVGPYGRPGTGGPGASGGNPGVSGRGPGGMGGRFGGPAGGFGPGGSGGSGGFGPGGSGYGGPGQGGGRPGMGPGSGFGAGAFGAEEAAARGAAGARGPAGPGGAGMGGPMGAAGARGKGEEDKEHRAPSYLEEDEDIWTGGINKVAPPVIGERPPRYDS
ncbi:hypothetical protein GCM10012275_08850 [Longimycelium tulufanense]|uniref:PPE domain-containing protein n=1 Tax=Longimycelium tulufanense TaxID=907463 RepID=A0A8J3C8C4_9PSEU|nr:PPE domain-containing protein [Longimycelium tulufanense]GGM40126.1 hypothetical protein GCM10012275_08850 [Longimycelium tulufanense]